MKYNIDKEVEVAPFPHFVVDGFLEEDLCERLNSSFPEMPSTYSEMYGRKKLEKFRNITDKLGNSWQEFQEILNSQEFIYSLLRKFKPHLEDSLIDFNKPVKIYNQRVNHGSHNDFYMYYDISEADVGYTREVHRDNFNRLVNFLIYLNDPQIKGGELVLFSSDKNTIHARQHPRNVKEFCRIKPKMNRAVFFLSNNHSYHSVEKITECQVSRKFIYGSLTSASQRIWK